MSVWQSGRHSRAHGWRPGSWLWPLAGALLLAACAAPTPTATPTPVAVVATELAAPLLRDLAAAYAEQVPGADLVIDVAAPADLADALSTGRAALALTSAPGPGQFATPLGYLRLAAVVQADNPVAALTVAQVRAAFAGRVTDWAQLGGAPGLLRPVAREAGAEISAVLKDAGLDEAGFTPNALVAPTWDAMAALVRENPGALGYLPEPLLNSGLKAIRLDTDWRVLLVAVAPAEPTGPARDFLAWAQSAAGQAVVAARHEPLP